MIVNAVNLINKNQPMTTTNKIKVQKFNLQNNNSEQKL